MSCPHYYFKNSDFYCLKREEYVSSDTYYQYCRNYDYGDCPVYKAEGVSGGCYITTACVCALGCPDNGIELTTLRNFRDTYLKRRPGGEKDVQEYYRYAPLIVEEIDKSSSRAAIYLKIYKNCIKPCLDAISKKEFQKAYDIYKSCYLQLKETYIKNTK